MLLGRFCQPVQSGVFCQMEPKARASVAKDLEITPKDYFKRIKAQQHSLLRKVTVT